MKRVGLYFGTFNPIHIGHLIIANHMVEFSNLDQVWFVITPKSPFKQKQSILDNNHRYQMVLEATEGYQKLKPSKIEFNLPEPNYTVNTLAHLSEKYGLDAGYTFSLIMGEDNLRSLHKWKNYEVILDNHEVYVYPRISENRGPHQLENHPKIHRVEAPIIEISSSFIRKSYKAGKDIRPLLPESVWRYIDEMNFYK